VVYTYLTPFTAPLPLEFGKDALEVSLLHRPEASSLVKVIASTLPATFQIALECLNNLSAYSAGDCPIPQGSPGSRDPARCFERTVSL